MASERKYTAKKDYASFPDRWKNKEEFHDMPEGWNPPTGAELEKHRVPRKGQMVDVSWESLQFEELPVTSAPLIAAGQFIGVTCRKENQDFLVCKRETKDPRKCLDEGKAATNCARSFLLKVREHCREEFRAHWHCLDNRNLTLRSCETSQHPVDECILEHIGVERPPLPKAFTC